MRRTLARFPDHIRSLQKSEDISEFQMQAQDFIRAAQRFKPDETAAAPLRGRSSLSAATRPPDEIRAHRVVPNDAEQRAGEPGNPPRLIVFVEPRSDVYIGDRPDAASKRKTRKASDRAEATVPVRAIGDFVVQNEVARHRDDCRDELSRVEGQHTRPVKNG